MLTPKRYKLYQDPMAECFCEIDESDRGSYVLEEDYRALCDEGDTLRSRLADVRKDHAEVLDGLRATQARLTEAEADLRIAFGWGDPFDMTPEDAKVWHRLNAKYLGREP